MWELLSAPDMLGGLGGVLGGAAALWGVCVAHMGLNTWKKQGIWQADSDLARRLLIAIFRFRDSLYSVRHPAMFHSEMEVENPDEIISMRETRLRGRRQAYARRWERHQSKKNDLESLLTEADAVWGRELSGYIKEIFDLEHELYSYISLDLDAGERAETTAAAEYRKMLSERRNILFDMMNDNDVFRIDFVSKLAPVEDYLRLKLDRRT